MSKRFIDTGFLDQRWIRKLPPEKKVFLIYLMLKCDNGGIIELDLDDASFWIGKKIETLDFLPSDYLIPLDDPCKFFMPKFIEWQYKDLSSNKFIVAQARQILEKYNLINPDFTLNLHKIHVNIMQNVPEFQEQGKGIGIDIGSGKDKKGVQGEKTWRNNFDLYLENCRNGLRDCISDLEYMKKLQELHPNYDIPKSIEKSFISFWGTKDGWDNKKKSKTETPDWQSTLMRTLKNSVVYLDKNGKSKTNIQQGITDIHTAMEEVRRQEASGNDNG